MKKLPVFFLVFALSAGAVFAGVYSDDEEEELIIGLTPGIEFGMTDVNKPNGAEEMHPYLEFSLEYENLFKDNTVYLYSGLAYNIGFTKEINDNEKEVFPNGLWFDFIIGYNLRLSSGSTLSPLLENENYFEFAPAEKDNIFGVIKLGVKFNQKIDDVGDIFFKLDVPFAYLQYGMEKELTFVGLDVTLGWTSIFGLGLKATGHLLIIPNDEAEEGEKYNGISGLSAIIFFENEPFYAEVEAAIPLKRSDSGKYPHSYFDALADASKGMSITPLFSYNIIKGLSAYISATIDRIGIKDSDIGFSPAIGVFYSF